MLTPLPDGPRLTKSSPESGNALGEQFRLQEEVQRLTFQHGHLPDVLARDGQSCGDDCGVEFAAVNPLDRCLRGAPCVRFLRGSAVRLDIELEPVGGSLLTEDASQIHAVLQLHARGEAQVSDLVPATPVPEAHRRDQRQEGQYGQNAIAVQMRNRQRGNAVEESGHRRWASLPAIGEHDAAPASGPPNRESSRGAASVSR